MKLKFNYYKKGQTNLNKGTFFSSNQHPYDIVYFIDKILILNGEKIYRCFCLGELSNAVLPCEFIDLKLDFIEAVDPDCQYLISLRDFIRDKYE